MIKTIIKILATILGIILGAGILNEIEKRFNNVADNQKDIEQRRYNEAQGYYRNQRSKQTENQSQKQGQAQSDNHAHTQKQEQSQNHNSVQEHDLNKDYAFIEYLKELRNYNQSQTQNQNQKRENANKEAKKSAANDKKSKFETKEKTSSSFDEKYGKNNRYKCKCGIKVKSKDERSIANFLTENYIAFEYEKEYQCGQNDIGIKTLHPDFYIKGPVIYKGRRIENVYIEYWGRNDPDYLKRMENKLNVYKNDRATLISLYPEDIYDCEKSLPIKLTQYKDHQINY